VVRRRFPDDVIDGLLDLNWWDWPIDQILSQEAALCSGDPLIFASAG
jgi:virginiamycin A acetyltransferase